MTPRLKSLELHGYKTFASRTNFEFPGVITAIVGPNGSGKSNIADAIRWVLGEQSFSLLRGRKTEDMIFAGSEQRPKAGMASATITFDNSDGWLPIDYSEVAITRRAYRDGQNEYLLNGQRVRLKEISELLAQSGLAERTYTIIGQGLVDAALSLKPEERRRFFEEAAGIGLYRTRKEESVNRLDATRRNLERVLDIINELEPRLANLERQAKRALEYERVKADLRLLLREWYGFHWHRLIQDVAHKQDVARTHEERQFQAREKLLEVENRLETKRLQVSEQRNTLNRWHTESAEKHRDREKINKDLAVLEERQRALTNQLQSLSSDQARLEEEQTNRTRQLESLQQETSRLSAEFAEARNQTDQARKQLAERTAEREIIEQEVRQERRKQVNLETRQVQLKAKIDELNNRLETLEISKKNLENALVKVNASLSQAQEQLARTDQDRQRYFTQSEVVNQAIQQKRKKAQDLEADRRQLQEESRKLSAEQTKNQAQLDVLEQADNSASGLNKGAKFLLDTRRAGKLSGSFQALSGLLEVPSEFEVAIAAVLGEFIDGIVIDDHTVIEDALKLLEAGENGRAVLFPTQLNSLSTVVKLEDPDCLGLAVDLVKTPNELSQVFGQLLGDTVIVKDRQAARRMRGNLPMHCRAVTLKGEVFWGSGVISAGYEGRSGLIARPRQKKELKSRIDQISHDLKIGNSKLLEMDKQLESLKKLLEEDEKKAQQLAQETNRVTREYQQAVLMVEQSKQRLDWSVEQIKETETKVKSTTSELTSGRQEVSRLDSEIKVVIETVRQKNRSLAELPIDELSRQVGFWQTNAAVADRAMKEVQRRVVEQQQVIQTSESQLTLLHNRNENLMNNLKQVEAERIGLFDREIELNKILEQLQAKITPAERELEEMEADYMQMQGDHLAAQQSMTLADRMNTQAQLDLARVRESMDSLRRRIEDDFGLVAFDYNTEVSGPKPLPFDGMVEQLPVVKEIPQEFEDNISRQRSLLRRMGAINPEAQTEYKEVKDRYEFLKTQVEDLKKADTDLRQVIVELDELMQREFMKTFDAVAIEFHQNFSRLFGGGSAQLVLMDTERPVEGGVDIEARLPGRREQGLSLLSGGERSLTAVALIFSLLKVSPTPFCVMDEVDAMLDEANVGRFRELLLELSQDSQFIVITHNRNTVQAADVIYGVTMGRDSASQIISLRVDEVGEDMVK